MKQHLVVLLTAALVFAGAGVARAESILLVDFESPAGFTIGGGPVVGYWGLAPLEGTAFIPSLFVSGGSQSGISSTDRGPRTTSCRRRDRLTGGCPPC